MQNRLDGGEALLEAFRSLGVDFIVSSPGSEWAPLWEAVARQKTSGSAGPRYIDVWHETLAVDVAIGYTLYTGRLQAVLLHAGAGLLQGTCGIHGALLAEVPLLVCSSEAITYGERAGVDPGSQWYRNLSIVGGTHGLVGGIVKWANQVGSVETLYEMVKRAGELAQRAPRGPMYLNIPVEVLLDAWSVPPSKMPVAAPARRISPPDEIERLADLVAAAVNPIILTESAGRSGDAFHALVAFAEAFGVPVIETQGTVCGNFPKTHPLYLGSRLEPFMTTTDLVLLVACRAPWYPPSNKPLQARTVVIDETPQRPHMVHQVLFADLYLEGDIAATLRATAERAPAKVDEPRRRQRMDRHAAAHRKLRADIEAAETKAGALDAIAPATLVKALREILSDETIYVDETITHARVVQQHLDWSEPQRYFYVQGGLGQGIGVALGIKVAAPNKPVALLLGDGTFLYNPIVPALAAARDNKLPILIVIFNNKKYLSMQLNHLRAYPDGVAVTHGLFHGVNLDTQPSLHRFGEPFDMHCAEVANLSELAPAVRTAAASVAEGRTAILNVMLTT
jgi:thiamine pyrophosphate-dependent acetolactate synthase large subunit-like protein